MHNAQEEYCRTEVNRMVQNLLKAGIDNHTLLDMIVEIREEANGFPTEILRKGRQLHEPVVEINRLTDEMIQAGANCFGICSQKLEVQHNEIYRRF